MDYQPKLQLIYFKMRELGEAPQLLMHAAGLRYEYLMAWDFFGKPWSEVKSTVIFKQLPTLMVDKIHVAAQSGAILRYLAGLAGMLPGDPIAAAKIDSILEGGSGNVCSSKSYCKFRHW